MHQHALTRGPRRRLGDQQGLTLVEVALSAAVLAIIAVGLAASLTQGPRLTRAAQEADAAEYAVRAKIAELSAAPFSEVAAAYNGHDFAVLLSGHSS